MEHVDGFHLLTSTNKLDRLRHHRADTQGSTTAGIAVEFSKHNTIEVQAVVKLLGRVHGILTRHGVHNEQCLIGVHGILQVSYLVHHLLIHGQTTSGVDDDHVVALGFSLADGILSDGYHILVFRFRIYRHAHLLTDHVQLLNGSRTIDVAGNQQRVLVLLGLQHVGQFSGERGLT